MKRTFGATLAVTLATLGLNFIATLWQAQVLGRDYRGVVAAINNIPTMAFIVATFGLTSSAAYFSGKDRESLAKTVTTISLSLFVWSIPVTLALHFGLPVLLHAQTERTRQMADLFLLSVPLQFIGNIPLAAIQGIGELKIWNVLRLLGPLALFAAAIAAIYNRTDPLYSLVIYSLSALTLVVLVNWIALFRLCPGPYRFDLGILRPLLHYGIPSGLAILPAQMNLRLDQVVMASILSSSALGVYSIAVAWSSLIIPVFAAVGQVTFPQLVALSEKEEQVAMLRRRVGAALAFGFVSALILAALTPLLPKIFGQGFSKAVPMALILICANICVGLNTMLEEAFRGMGLPKRPMVAELTGLGFMVVLLALLLKPMAGYGASIASFVSYGAALAVLLHYLKQDSGVSAVALLKPDFRNLRAPMAMLAARSKQ
ncbi:MAG: oligosaccharide flippase family protein [Armatimonadetes bacterium]|nr:oligosaccharide flippase family protein [Armatimonadota bacterium]